MPSRCIKYTQNTTRNTRKKNALNAPHTLFTRTLILRVDYSPVVRKNRAGPKSVKTEISFNKFCLALANQYQKHILILLQLKM